MYFQVQNVYDIAYVYETAYYFSKSGISLITLLVFLLIISSCVYFLGNSINSIHIIDTYYNHALKGVRVASRLIVD